MNIRDIPKWDLARKATAHLYGHCHRGQAHLGPRAMSRRRFIRTTAGAALYVLIALSVATIIPPWTAEGATTVQKIPVIIDVDPSFCPEAPSAITGNGEFVIQAHTTTSANGQMHVSVTASGHGVATDESGGVWTMSDGDNFVSFNGFVGQPMEMTKTENFHLVSHGAGSNILIHEVLHIKVLADGTVTVDFDKESGASEGCELGVIFP